MLTPLLELAGARCRHADFGARRGAGEQRLAGGAGGIDRHRLDARDDFGRRHEAAVHQQLAAEVVALPLRAFQRHQQRGHGLRLGAVELGLFQALGGFGQHPVDEVARAAAASLRAVAAWTLINPPST